MKVLLHWIRSSDNAPVALARTTEGAFNFRHYFAFGPWEATSFRFHQHHCEVCVTMFTVFTPLWDFGPRMSNVRGALHHVVYDSVTLCSSTMWFVRNSRQWQWNVVLETSRQMRHLTYGVLMFSDVLQGRFIRFLLTAVWTAQVLSAVPRQIALQSFEFGNLWHSYNAADCFAPCR